MHEYGIVEQLILEFLKTPKALAPAAPRLVRLRYGPGLTAASLRQAFAVQSAGTPLSRARLELEERPVTVSCPCGASLSPYAGETAHEHGGEEHDHDHGLPYLSCDRCGAVHAIPHFNTLELTHAE